MSLTGSSSLTALDDSVQYTQPLHLLLHPLLQPFVPQAAEQVHEGYRFSVTEDEDLGPVASDLMLRLSETNSTLKAREAEVASLQAQNALLRQQVEQQQRELDAVGDSLQECEECEGGTEWWAGDEQCGGEAGSTE